MIKQLQQDPVSRKPLHIDFVRIEMTSKIRVRVSIEIVGVAAGVKTEGGILDTVTREVEVECLPGNIPKHMPVDVTALSIGDALRVSQLVAPEGVTVVDDPEKVVVHVTHPTAEKEPEAAAAEAAPEITEPEVLKKGKAATEEEGEEGKGEEGEGEVGPARHRRPRKPGGPLRGHTPQRGVPRRGEAGVAGRHSSPLAGVALAGRAGDDRGCPGSPRSSPDSDERLGRGGRRSLQVQWHRSEGRLRRPRRSRAPGRDPAHARAGLRRRPQRDGLGHLEPGHDGDSAAATGRARRALLPPSATWRITFSSPSRRRTGSRSRRPWSGPSRSFTSGSPTGSMPR